METSGAILDADVLSKLMGMENVLGLAEVMNYPGVIFRDPEVLKKIKSTGTKRVDGARSWTEGLRPDRLCLGGISSDHECTNIEEAQEKTSYGMYIMLREGSAAKNLKDLLPLVTPRNARQFLFVSDDRHPVGHSQRRSHRFHG